MSTLKRETNPQGGYTPSLLPQHEGKSGTYLATGENNPLPTASYIQSAAGLWIPQKGKDDGSANVNVTNMPTKQNVGVVDPLPAGNNAIGKVSLTDSVLTNFGLVDGWAAGNNGLLVASETGAFNGSSWDRWRNNQESVLLPSSARTFAVTSPIQTNYNHKGILLTVDVTAINGTATILPSIKGIDPSTGIAFDLHSVFGNIQAVGKYTYVLYPSAISTGTAVKAAANMLLPRRWVLKMESDGQSITYSVSYSLIL